LISEFFHLSIIRYVPIIAPPGIESGIREKITRLGEVSVILNPMDIDFLTRQLCQVEHFRRLSTEQCREIVTAGQVRHFQRDQVVFLEDEPCAGLCVLLEGKVQLCKLSPQGQVSILTILEPVKMFNEVAALDGGPNPATVVAIDESAVWQISAADLQSIILRYPGVGLGLLRVLAARNRLLVSQFEDLSFRTVLARAAKLLVELSQGGAHPIDRRKNPNHQLAARIATVPEAFSRSLRVFKDARDITCSDRQIIVANPAHLLQIAQVGPDAPPANQGDD
jgi:CRP/FNR family transcriptional regulator